MLSSGQNIAIANMISRHWQLPPLGLQKAGMVKRQSRNGDASWAIPFPAELLPTDGFSGRGSCFVFTEEPYQAQIDSSKHVVI